MQSYNSPLAYSWAALQLFFSATCKAPQLVLQSFRIRSRRGYWKAIQEKTLGRSQKLLPGFHMVASPRLFIAADLRSQQRNGSSTQWQLGILLVLGVQQPRGDRHTTVPKRGSGCLLAVRTSVASYLSSTSSTAKQFLIMMISPFIIFIPIKRKKPHTL